MSSSDASGGSSSPQEGVWTCDVSHFSISQYDTVEEALARPHEDEELCARAKPVLDARADACLSLDGDKGARRSTRQSFSGEDDVKSNNGVDKFSPGDYLNRSVIFEKKRSEKKSPANRKRCTTSSTSNRRPSATTDPELTSRPRRKQDRPQYVVESGKEKWAASYESGSAISSPPKRKRSLPENSNSSAITDTASRSDCDGDMKTPTGSSVSRANTKTKKRKKSIADKAIGSVGYSFCKYFPGHGYFQGSAVAIRPGAKGGKDRRCRYEDGVEEDLSLAELQALHPPASTAGVMDDTRLHPTAETGDTLLIQPKRKCNKRSSKKESSGASVGSSSVASSPRKRRRVGPPMNSRKTTRASPRIDSDYDEDETKLSPARLPWEERFAQLIAYKEQNGDCLVRRGHLATWVRKQRAEYRNMKEGKQSIMTPSRIERLNKLGFVWRKYQFSWEKMYDELVAYREKNGDCLVNINSTDLGKWVAQQRRQYRYMQKGKPSCMTPYRVQRLETLNFVWDTRGNAWEKMFNQLMEYKKHHGDCLVSKGQGYLAAWVVKQRQEYRKVQEGQRSVMTPTRIERLNELGFSWTLWGKRPGARKSNAKTDEKEEVSSFDTSPKKDM